MSQEVNKHQGRLMPLGKYKWVYRVLLCNADLMLVNTCWCRWEGKGSEQVISACRAQLSDAIKKQR